MNKKAMSDESTSHRREFESELDALIDSLKRQADVDCDLVAICCSALTSFKTDKHFTFSLVGMASALGVVQVDELAALAHTPTDSIGPASRRPAQGESEPRHTKVCWMIGMTEKFLSAVQSIDRKLQGRILEAVTDILKSPTTVKGDTIKPLTRELKGLWRYRLGDYRLIYQPLPDRMQILLLDFSHRGAAY